MYIFVNWFGHLSNYKIQLGFSLYIETNNFIYFYSDKNDEN